MRCGAWLCYAVLSIVRSIEICTFSCCCSGCCLCCFRQSVAWHTWRFCMGWLPGHDSDHGSTWWDFWLSVIMIGSGIKCRAGAGHLYEHGVAVVVLQQQRPSADCEQCCKRIRLVPAGLCPAQLRGRLVCGGRRWMLRPGGGVMQLNVAHVTLAHQEPIPFDVSLED